MQHCVELKRAGTQPSLPLLGNFCLGLGLQMRVRLGLVCWLSEFVVFQQSGRQLRPQPAGPAGAGVAGALFVVMGCIMGC